MENSSITRLRPITISTKLSSQAYKTIASDDIELETDYGPSTNRERYSPVHKSPHESAQSFTQSFWKRTWIDVKIFPWRRFFFHMLLFLMVSGLIVLFFLMIFLPSLFTVDDGDFCKPDGSFEYPTHTYSPWKPEGVFSINMKFNGSLTFDEAKFIDIAWDVGIGRGGQALLGFMSYRVFTMALTRTMEASYVSHDTFRAVTLQSDTATGTAMLMKDFFKTRGHHARVTLFWTILAGSFVLLLPTWVGAMTGYTTEMKPRVQSKDGSLISASRFTPVVYVIHDGARLGGDRKNDTYIAVPRPHRNSQPECYNSFSCDSDVAKFNGTEGGFIEFTTTVNDRSSNSSIDCRWLWSISRYVSEYGFLGTSTYLNTTLHEPQPRETSNVTTRRFFNPPLNVSAHFLIPRYLALNPANVDDEWNTCPFGQYWQNPIDQEYPFISDSPLLWDKGSDTSYTSTAEFEQEGSCQQGGSKIKYQWGFSFLLLFAFVATFLVWTIGLLALYMDSWLHSRLDVSQRYLGMERALLDISESILSKVDGEDVQLYGNHQLRVLAAGNMLTYSDLQVDSLVITRWTEYKRWWLHEFSFKRWIREEKWWLCALLFFSLMFGLGWSSYVRWIWWGDAAFLPGFGVLLVLLLGRARRARWVVFALFFLVFFVLDIWRIILRFYR